MKSGKKNRPRPWKLRKNNAHRHQQGGCRDSLLRRLFYYLSFLAALIEVADGVLDRQLDWLF
jgi:hypothetical protein